MDPAIGTLALTLLAVMGVWLLLARWRHRVRKDAGARDQLLQWQRSGRYWGVRVAARGEPGCEAMQRVAAHIFPITSAPPLPLPDCGRRRCRCCYQPYPERRSGERRSGAERRDVIRLDSQSIERRRGGDRRRHNDPWQGQRL